ncbi:MAG: DUF1330 domain-containing protein [Henriciella sp.]|nr:DUF1330 domain-containing protein [Henriciella sp.]
MKGFIAGGLLGLCAGFAATACVGLPSSEAVSQEAISEPPAYMIVLGEVYDRPAFMEGYVAKLPPLYEKYGGHYIALGGGPTLEVLEGDYAPASYVIGKWDSMAAARAFWNSPEYAELMAARIDNAWGDFDVLLVQGLSAAAPQGSSPDQD